MAMIGFQLLLLPDELIWWILAQLNDYHTLVNVLAVPEILERVKCRVVHVDLDNNRLLPYEYPLLNLKKTRIDDISLLEQCICIITYGHSVKESENVHFPPLNTMCLLRIRSNKPLDDGFEPLTGVDSEYALECMELTADLNCTKLIYAEKWPANLEIISQVAFPYDTVDDAVTFLEQEDDGVFYRILERQGSLKLQAEESQIYTVMLSNVWFRNGISLDISPLANLSIHGCHSSTISHLREAIESAYSVTISMFDTEFELESTVEVLPSWEEARALTLAYGKYGVSLVNMEIQPMTFELRGVNTIQNLAINMKDEMDSIDHLILHTIPIVTLMSINERKVLKQLRPLIDGLRSLNLPYLTWKVSCMWPEMSNIILPSLKKLKLIIQEMDGTDISPPSRENLQIFDTVESLVTIGPINGLFQPQFCDAFQNLINLDCDLKGAVTHGLSFPKIRDLRVSINNENEVVDFLSWSLPVLFALDVHLEDSLLDITVCDVCSSFTTLKRLTMGRNPPRISAVGGQKLNIQYNSASINVEYLSIVDSFFLGKTFLNFPSMKEFQFEFGENSFRFDGLRAPVLEICHVFYRSGNDSSPHLESIELSNLPSLRRLRVSRISNVKLIGCDDLDDIELSGRIESFESTPLLRLRQLLMRSATKENIINNLVYDKSARISFY
jgi:hypothetical protein